LSQLVESIAAEGVPLDMWRAFEAYTKEPLALFVQVALSLAKRPKFAMKKEANAH
jgi:hypothetical protein